MRYLGHEPKHISYVPRGAERLFVSRYNAAHSCGKLLLLTQIPSEDILAITSEEPGLIEKYFPQVEPDCYVPANGCVAELYDIPTMRPVVRHDVIMEVSYGNTSLPTIGRLELDR